MKLALVSFAFLLFLSRGAFAQSLPEIISTALERSPDLRAAKAEVSVQQLTAKSADQSRLVPQVSLGYSVQKLKFDRLKDDGAGGLVSNDGMATSINVTATYDLQKLFGPESDLAAVAVKNAELMSQLSHRAIVRDTKKAFYNVVEIREEIKAFRAALDRFNRVGGVLERERRFGVNTSLENGQFRIQRDLVEADLQTRTADLETAYAQLASLLGETSAQTEERFADRLTLMPPVFSEPEKLAIDQLAASGDPVLMKTLRGDADLAVAEADHFTRIPLPSVYLKAARDNSTVFSSDGPQTTIEAGLTLPLDAIVTRGTQRSLLGAKAIKATALADRAIMDYSNQIRLQASQLKRVAAQMERVKSAREESQRLLDQAFKFYGQKRIDAIGTTDLFQKHLQAVRNLLVNTYQLQVADAELEYLVGGGHK